MSLLTTLAYAITAAVRPRVRDAEIADLKAQVDDLRRQVDEALPRIERQRDDWQALAMQYRSALFRLPQPVQTEINRAAQALQAYATIQQANLQQAAMQNGPYMGQQLGMQNFGQQLEEFVCNCTPGRHDLFVRG